MKKRIVGLLFTIILTSSFLIACKSNDDNPNDDNPFEDDPTEEIPQDLDVQDFNDALSAFSFGKNYFENVAEHYETVLFGRAVPSMSSISGPQKINTRRYKSANGDFLYETNNYTTSGLIKKHFTLMTCMPADNNTVYFKKLDGADYINVDGDYLYGNFSNFSLNTLDTVENVSSYKNIIGGNPKNFSIYVIDQTTIESVEDFHKDLNADYAYSFKLILNENSVANYRKQVSYYSGYPYNNFISLALEIKMDKYGRILQTKAYDNYSISALGVSVQTNLESTEYYSYRKKPTIDYSNFSISYNSSAEVNNFTITLDADGGTTTINNLKVEYEGSVGPLPNSDKAGYFFGGWYTERNGQGDEVTPTYIYLFEKNITLYANWIEFTELTYRITPDGKGYEVSSAPKDITIALIKSTHKGLPVVGIGPSAFYNCVLLERIILDDIELQYIGDRAFYGCTSLISIQLPYTLTKIGTSAFDGCSSITTLIIPQSVENIEATMFSNMLNLAELEINENNLNYCSINNIIYSKDGTRLLFVPNALTGRVVIPCKVVSIEAKAFSNCAYITEIIFEKDENDVVSITELKESTFSGCGVESISIPKEVTKFGVNLFQNCANLATVIFERYSDDSVGFTSLSNYMFDGAGLTNISIPKEVKSFGTYLFRNCVNMTTITFERYSDNSVVFTDLSNYMFDGAGLTNISIPKEVKSFGTYLFRNCVNMTTITFERYSDGSVGFSALGTLLFGGSGLTTISIPKEVKTLGLNLFKDCANLANITFECDNNGNVGFSAFGGAMFDGTALTEIIIPIKVTDISTALRNAKQLLNITVENGNTTYYSRDGILYTNKHVLIVYPAGRTTSQFIVEEGVTGIEQYAFSYAANLKILNIASSVTTIGNFAFSSCVNLENIIINRSAIIDSNITVLGGSSIFIGVENIKCLIYVPFDSLNNYLTATNWSNNNIITLLQANQETFVTQE